MSPAARDRDADCMFGICAADLNAARCVRMDALRDVVEEATRMLHDGRAVCSCCLLIWLPASALQVIVMEAITSNF